MEWSWWGEVVYIFDISKREGMPKDIKKWQEIYISSKCSVEGIMSPLNVSWKT